MMNASADAIAWGRIGPSEQSPPTSRRVTREAGAGEISESELRFEGDLGSESDLSASKGDIANAGVDGLGVGFGAEADLEPDGDIDTDADSDASEDDNIDEGPDGSSDPEFNVDLEFNVDIVDDPPASAREADRDRDNERARECA